MVGGRGMWGGSSGQLSSLGEINAISTVVNFKWIDFGFISLPHHLTVFNQCVSAARLGKLVHTFPLQTFLCLQVKRALLFSPSRKFSL